MKTSLESNEKINKKQKIDISKDAEEAMKLFQDEISKISGIHEETLLSEEAVTEVVNGEEIDTIESLKLEEATIKANAESLQALLQIRSNLQLSQTEYDHESSSESEYDIKLSTWKSKSAF